MGSGDVSGSRIRPRIESLSDLVFGLALSLGSFILISRTTATPYELVSGIALFAFSFTIVVWIWTGYTRIMILLPMAISGTFLLNLVLLFLVAIEPYLFYVLFSGPFSLLDFASAVYALDAGAMMFILAALGSLLLGEEKKIGTHRLSPARLSRIRGVVRAETASGVVFLVSAIPYLWVPFPGGISYLRFDLWYANFAIFFVLTSLRRRSTSTLEKESEPVQPPG